MKKRLGCCLLVGVFAMGALVVVGILGTQYLRWRQDRARIEFAPPQVQITSPRDGFSAEVGSFLPISATVSFSPQTPVRILEWWLDGALLESQPLEPEADSSLHYAEYDLFLPTEEPAAVTTPPLIAETFTDPQSVQQEGCGEPSRTVISATVSDEGAVQRVTARIPGYGEVDMTSVGGEVYQATVGPFDSTGAVSILIQAWDNAGSSSTAGPLTVTVVCLG